MPDAIQVVMVDVIKIDLLFSCIQELHTFTAPTGKIWFQLSVQELRKTARNVLIFSSLFQAHCSGTHKDILKALSLFRQILVYKNNVYLEIASPPFICLSKSLAA